MATQNFFGIYIEQLGAKPQTSATYELRETNLRRNAKLLTPTLHKWSSIGIGCIFIYLTPLCLRETPIGKRWEGNIERQGRCNYIGKLKLYGSQKCSNLQSKVSDSSIPISFSFLSRCSLAYITCVRCAPGIIKPTTSNKSATRGFCSSLLTYYSQLVN